VYRTYALLALVVLIGGVSMVRCMRAGRLAASIASAYFAIWLGLAAIVQVEALTFPVAGLNDTAALKNLQAIESASWIAYVAVLGFVLRVNILTGTAQVAPRWASPRVPAAYSQWADHATKIRLTSIGAALASIAMLGGIPIFLTRVQAGLALESRIGVGQLPDIAYTLCQSAGSATLLMMNFLRLHSPQGRNPSKSDVLLVSGCFLLSNPLLASPRFWIGSTFGALLYQQISARFEHRRAARITAALWLLGLLIIFPFADNFRSTVTPAAFDYIALTESMRIDPDYDSFPTTIAGVVAVERAGHTFGVQIAGIGTALVPRSIFPAKPQHTGAWVAEKLDWNFNNTASPFPTEIYIDFGLVGVFVVMFLFGSVILRLDLILEHGVYKPGWHTVALFSAFFSTIFLRGSTLSAMFRFWPMFAILLYLGSPGPLKHHRPIARLETSVERSRS